MTSHLECIGTVDNICNNLEKKLDDLAVLKATYWNRIKDVFCLLQNKLTCVI